MSSYLRCFRPLLALLVVFVPGYPLRAATPWSTRVTTIRVGRQPIGVAVDPRIHRAYVGNSLDNTVSVIDTITNSVVDTIRVGLFPADVEVGLNTNVVYVMNNYASTVSVIETTTNKVVQTIRVGHFPGGIAVDIQRRTPWWTPSMWGLTLRLSW
ncbi:MAG: YncE family protein [Herpetosiphonaceae bacterium]|nr:YncE family protein [Herpetosiphonaceae bacterium]